MSLHLSDFQSLIQLAAALNAGYAATVSLIGNTLTDEVNSVADLVAESREKAKKVKSNSAGRRPLMKIRQDSVSLHGELTKAAGEFMSYQEGYVRIFSILVSVFAIFLLGVTTLCKDHEENQFFLLLVIFCYLPFLLGVALCAYVIFLITVTFRPRREILEKDYNNLLNLEENQTEGAG